MHCQDHRQLWQKINKNVIKKYFFKYYKINLLASESPKNVFEDYDYFRCENEFGFNK